MVNNNQFNMWNSNVVPTKQTKITEMLALNKHSDENITVEII